MSREIRFMLLALNVLKGKLSPCSIKNQAMKIYGGVEVELHEFLM
jgi:hypothetical protein